MHGIGKITALGLLRSQSHSIRKLGDVSVGLDEVINQCSQFILGCYGVVEADSEDNGRYKVWTRMMSHIISSAPKLQSLSPNMKPFGRMWPGLTFRLLSEGTP